jgi:ABC-type amino acid transport substrate-binding protein
MPHRAILVLAAAALVSLQPVSAADLADVKARGTLRVIVSADEAPETFDPKRGARPGFERELLETFARVQGITLDVLPAKSLADRIPMLLAGKGDLIVAIFDTPERRQQIAFSAEIMPTYNVAVTLAPKPAPKTLGELRREKVGVVRGAAPGDDAAAAGVQSIQRFESLKDMLPPLGRGEIGALVIPISEFALAAKHEPKLTAGVTVGATGSISWGVRKEDTGLRAALDTHLANVRKSASWNLLLVKYFGEQAPLVLGRRR